MNRTILVAPLLLTLAGCLGGMRDGPTTGWRFEMGRPGEVRSPSIYRQRDGEVDLYPLNSGPQAQQPGVAQVVQCGHAQFAPPQYAPQFIPQQSCTLDDLCHKIDALLLRMPVGK